MAGDKTNNATCQKLLDAAGEIFADVGFRDATVRDICKRAGANIAAVNYHFGDKQRLYNEVIQYAHRCALEKYPAHLEILVDAPPAERLRAFIRAFLLRIFDLGRPTWHGRLMAREIADPTAALDALVEHGVRPQFEMLQGVIRELLGPGATPTVVRRCAFSVVGQILYYWHSQPVIHRLFPGLKLPQSDIDGLAEHITAFSLSAIRGLAKAHREKVG